MGIDRIGDGDEMLKEFRSHVLGRGIVLRQFQRDGKHGAAKEGHPRGAIRLFEASASGQRLRTVEDADIIQAKKAAAEDILAFRILAVDPPRKADYEFLERTREEDAVPLAAVAR